MRYLNPRRRYYYFRFPKTHGRYIRILFQVSFLTNLSLWFFLHHAAKFHPNRTRRSYDVISIFQDGGGQSCWIFVKVILNHPRSVIVGPSFAFKFRVDRIHSFVDMANQLEQKSDFKKNPTADSSGRKKNRSVRVIRSRFRTCRRSCTYAHVVARDMASSLIGLIISAVSFFDKIPAFYSLKCSFTSLV